MVTRWLFLSLLWVRVGLFGLVAILFLSFRFSFTFALSLAVSSPSTICIFLSV